MKLESFDLSHIAVVSEVTANTVEPSAANLTDAGAQTETDAGRNSKLGELFNQGAQTREKLLTGLTAANADALPIGFGKEATVTRIGDKVVIYTGDGDDQVSITQNAKTGDVTVSVNGVKQTYSGKDKDNLVILTAEGNDTVTVGKGVTVKLQIQGGSGNDNLQGGDGDDVILGEAGDDVIEAGAGNDFADGGEGRDYLNGSKGNDNLFGGASSDVVYGGDGDDGLAGGDGDDYLEGGKGSDNLFGGAGRDVLSGGIGDDNMDGGSGNDVLYAGQGKDNLAGGNGLNKIFSQTDDTVQESTGFFTRSTVVTVELAANIGTSVSVEGSDEFKERVEADLEMLRSSPNGRQMLTALDNSKHKVVIAEFNAAGASASSANNIYGTIDAKTGKAGKGDDVKIMYNPQFAPVSNTDPIAVLYHEMSHAYNITTGTLQPGFYQGDGTNASPGAGNDNPVKDRNGKIVENPAINVRNLERQAVGLENNGVLYDFDNDPNTPKTTANPEPLTENGLRAEMNRPKRASYR